MNNAYNLNLSDLDLPPILKNAVIEVADSVQAPYAIVLSSALSAMSLAYQEVANVKMPIKKVVPVSLYLMVLAKSGDRKTTVDNYFIKAILAYESKQEALFKFAQINYEASFATWKLEKDTLLKSYEKNIINDDNKAEIRGRLNKHLLNEPAKPEKRRLIYRDVTPQAITQAYGRGASSLGLISNEAVSVLNGRGFQDIGLLNTLWDGSKIIVDRASSDNFAIENARLTCSLMIQPQVFEEIYAKNEIQLRDSGFFARVLFACPESLQGTRFLKNFGDSCFDSLERFNNRITQVLESTVSGQDRKELTFRKEATDLWQDWYNHIEHSIQRFGKYEMISDVASKNPEIVARLAGLFQLIEDDSTEITGFNMQRAIAVSNWYLNQSLNFIVSKKLQLPSEFVTDLNRLFEWLKKKYSEMNNSLFVYKSFDIEKMHIRRFGPLRSKAKLDAALDILIANKVIEVFAYGPRRPKLIRILPGITTTWQLTIV